MALQVSDPLFDIHGRPVLVQEEAKSSGARRLVMDRDSDKVTQAFRHGYVKGLEPDMRKDLNNLLDEVSQISKVEDKVQKLQVYLDGLEEDPGVKSVFLAEYVKAEMAHLMHSHRYTPRYYRHEEIE